MDDLLPIECLSIRHACRPLVSGVSLSVAAGERVGLIGESGSGKSLTALAAIGVTGGLLAAAAARAGDDGVAATLDILIAFPTLLLAMLIVAASDGTSLGTAILTIGIASSSIVARLTRILARRVLAMDYITAARVSGTGWLGIVRIHVLPNI